MDEKPTVTVRKSKDSSGGNPNMAAYILIGIGIFFLLGNLGIIAGILRLWPLIFVAIGIYLLMGRNNAPSELHHEHFSAPKGETQSARVKLNLSVGEASIAPVSDPTVLIEADVTSIGEVRFVAEGEADKFVSLGQTSNMSTEWLNPANWFHHDTYKDLRWTVGLNPDVPTNLDIQGGVGQARIDLSRFDLTGLEIASGVGEMNVTLPARAAHLAAEVRVGVGKLDLTIPSGTSVEATVKGGVGETNITLPMETAARVEASSGVGELKVTSRLQKISGTESGISPRGVWETPDFESAERKIVIHFDGGIGALRVR